MEIDSDRHLKLQKILKRLYGIEFSLDKTTEIGDALLKYFQVLYEMYKDNSEEINKRLEELDSKKKN